MTGSAASVLSRFSDSPERSPSAEATSSVKLTTQPSVCSGRKRKPCAVLGATRIAAGAENGNVAASNVIFAAAPLDQQHLKTDCDGGARE